MRRLTLMPSLPFRGAVVRVVVVYHCRLSCHSHPAGSLPRPTLAGHTDKQYRGSQATSRVHGLVQRQSIRGCRPQSMLIVACGCQS